VNFCLSPARAAFPRRARQTLVGAGGRRTWCERALGQLLAIALQMGQGAALFVLVLAAQ